MRTSSESSGDKGQQHSLKFVKLPITHASPEITLGLIEKFITKLQQQLVETRQHQPKKEAPVSPAKTEMRPDPAPQPTQPPNLPNAQLAQNPYAGIPAMPPSPAPTPTGPQVVRTQKGQGGQTKSIKAPAKPLADLTPRSQALYSRLLTSLINLRNVVKAKMNEAVTAETNLEKKLVREDQGQENDFIEKDKKQEQTQVRLEALQEKLANKHELEQKAESAPLHRAEARPSKEQSDDNAPAAETPRPSLGK